MPIFDAGGRPLWCSGNIPAPESGDPGQIPGGGKLTRRQDSTHTAAGFNTHGGPPRSSPHDGEF